MLKLALRNVFHHKVRTGMTLAALFPARRVSRIPVGEALLQNY